MGWVMLKADPRVPAEDWAPFPTDAARSDAMLALAGDPPGTGPLLTLWRGQAGRGEPAVSSWTDNRADAGTFGPVVRSARVPFDNVIAIVRHDDGLMEYVVAGYPV